MFRHQLRGCSLTLLTAAALLSCGSNAARGWEVRWQTDLKTAAREARRQQKPMLVEFTASWCGYCRRMKQTTFRDREVIRHVNGCFVPVSVDADKNRELMRAVGVTGLPTTVIISPKFEIVKKITGYQTPAQMSRHLGGLCPQRELAKTAVRPEPPAFGGRCLVSMLDDRKLRSGSAKFVTRYRGRTLQFASAENKRKFDAAPKKYWPAAEGDCPVTLRENAVRVTGDPTSAVIYRGRLWFFASMQEQKQFAKSPAKYAATRTAKRN
jgi:YHS domain-containing protein/thioredoxin-related protein